MKKLWIYFVSLLEESTVCAILLHLVDPDGNPIDFKSSDLQRLSSIAFVPIQAEKGTAGPTIRWLPPSQCYLAGQGGAAFHSKLFVFVDFGTSANAFLTACGTRSQPSVEEVAKILLNNPLQFYELAQGPVKSVEFLLPHFYFFKHIVLVSLQNSATSQ